MPNNITNIIKIDTTDSRIKQILEEIKDDEIGIGSIDFNKIIPMPDNIFKGNLGVHEFEQYGTNNWYDWSIKNWGSKWNAYSLNSIESGDSIEFETAWSSVQPILKALSQKYPDVVFNYRWADEDFGANLGKNEWQNGEELSQNIPNSFSKEAYEMASDILGIDLGDYGLKLSEDGTHYEYVDGLETKSQEMF